MTGGQVGTGADRRIDHDARADLLAAVQLSWAQLCQRVADGAATAEERVVWATVRALLGEDGGEA